MSLITYVTRIHFADRILEDALPEEMRKLAIGRPLVVTDAAAGIDEGIERLADAMPGACRPVWLEPLRDLPGAQASRIAAESFRNDDCDGIVALGGAAALDLSRRLGVRRGDRPAPLVAIPTPTASVGLGPVAGAGDQPPGTPSVILCDPTLTVGLDAAGTAACGIDALTHCIEAYLGTTYNPPADGIALEGVRRAGAHLEKAVADGRDLEARREMLAAALNAGLAAQKGLGGADAVARALEAEAGIAARHGWLHAAILPRVIAFNAPAVEERFAAIREALRLPPGMDLAAALAELGSRIGLPGRIGFLGLEEAALRRAARTAAADPVSRTNPRHATAEDYLRLLEDAW